MTSTHKGLIAAIEERRWQEWALARPRFESQRPLALETYLWSLERHLDDAPETVEGLSVSDMQTLLILLNTHRNAVAAELGRQALLSTKSTLPGAIGGLVSALSATAAPLIALAQLLLVLPAFRSDSRQVRLEKLSDRIETMIAAIERRFW